VGAGLEGVIAFVIPGSYNCSNEIQIPNAEGSGAMDWEERIIIDPDILAGKPIIKGTRLSVEFIIDLLAQGWSEADILQNYPGLTHDDIQACLRYASETLRAEKVYPLKA
jgi:uncharacterized protein (DUF433 family)